MSEQVVENVHVLAMSDTCGRYTLGNTGVDLTQGLECDIWLDGRWITGHVEIAYVTAVILFDRGVSLVRGYYFECEDGSRCGLCVGMKVRVSE